MVDWEKERFFSHKKGVSMRPAQSSNRARFRSRCMSVRSHGSDRSGATLERLEPRIALSATEELLTVTHTDDEQAAAMASRTPRKGYEIHRV